MGAKHICYTYTSQFYIWFLDLQRNKPSIINHHIIFSNLSSLFTLCIDLSTNAMNIPAQKKNAYQAYLAMA